MELLLQVSMEEPLVQLDLVTRQQRMPRKERRVSLQAKAKKRKSLIKTVMIWKDLTHMRSLMKLLMIREPCSIKAAILRRVEETRVSKNTLEA